MSEAIVIAIITSAVTLFGVILSNSKTAAVTTNEIKHLAEEVQVHNNFAGTIRNIALAPPYRIVMPVWRSRSRNCLSALKSLNGR